jgi:pimeloyl-ACP methyl ester carboxylesterase
MDDLTIVLVHGAWHTPNHYEALAGRLKARGLSVTVPQLPSTGSETPMLQTMATDTEYLRDTVLYPLVDAGKKVVLVAHSYGGCPGGGAARGLSIDERKSTGKPGGIIGMFFISAFLAQEGELLLDKMPPDQTKTWVVVNVRVLDLNLPSAVRS